MLDLYRVSIRNVQKLKETSFNSEKEIQRIVEKNVSTLFGIELIRSEFAIDQKRIDTLCYCEKTKSFVIIEFKLKINIGVIDQGINYRSLINNYRSDVVLEYNNKKSKHYRIRDFKWEKTKVIFISTQFSDTQKNPENINDDRFELWEIICYDESLIGLNKISKHRKLIPDVPENRQFEKMPPEIQSLYKILREEILKMGEDIEEKFNIKTISFRQKNVFTDLVLQKRKINVFVNLKKGELQDPSHVAEDVSDVGHWGNGDYRLSLKKEEEIDDAIGLIKQSYQNQQ
ncbi:MAG: DUF5655 domain-containing protein [Flavobacteriaceae bacterium]|nr:DUF5655 domain-containing protein [Flavobacteriaceae bacterium]